MKFLENWKRKYVIKNMTDTELINFQREATNVIKDRKANAKLHKVGLLESIIDKQYYSKNGTYRDKIMVLDMDGQHIKYPTEHVDKVLSSSYVSSSDVIKLLEYMRSSK